MKALTDNLILNTDSYKVSHYRFLNPKTEYLKSYIESRVNSEYDYTIFFGLQYFLKRYLNTRITLGMIDQAEEFLKAHLPSVPFNREGWDYIVREYDGRLPLRIRAVPEGTRVPIGNALVTVENTDPKLAWLGAYFETALLRAVWYGTTVATRSNGIRNLILRYLEETGDPDSIDFKFVDFGARGAASTEAAMIGGAANLINFMGTDNIVGILASMEYYESKDVTGFSIPASEHSVTCEEGEDGEIDFYRRALEQYGGEGKMISLVADTYSFDRSLDMWCNDLKDELLENGATVVIRPDSGDPTDMVMMALRRLKESYGGGYNEKGYFVLHPSVRIIQGDGVNTDKIEEILENMKGAKFSADNVVFGCGGYLLQDLNRDTQRFAQKGCATKREGQEGWLGIRKRVQTDNTKASKAGDLILVKRWGVAEPITIDAKDKLKTDEELMRTVYLDGLIFVHDRFDNIRERVRE